MKRTSKEPRLLPNVMEAIASLKEKHGSTQKQIVEHINHIFKKSKDSPRNVTMQIRRAIEHGMHSGLIKQRSGKYTLGLDKKDYAVFRRFRQIDDPTSDCNSCKRGRRRGRHGRRGRRRRSGRRRRRGRRRPISADDATEDSESARSLAGGTPEPMDRRGRRGRRRRKRRGRRRGRRGRRHSTNDDNSDSVESVPKDTITNNPPEKRKSDQEKIDYQSKNSSNHNHQESSHQDRNHLDRNHDRDDDMECGNPECLCNIKQEGESPRCMSRQNYFNDSYLN